LKIEDAEQNLIDKVKMLVLKHEEGGNDEQNLLKDADSISFFENNVPIFLTEQVAKKGKDKVKEKFNWMFNRITSEKAKQIARFWHENAIKELEKQGE